jgi:hypothetical protein
MAPPSFHLTVAITTLAASPVALLPQRQPVRAACESLSTLLCTLQEIFTDPSTLPPCGLEQRVAPLNGPQTSPAGTEPRVASPLAVMPPPVGRTVAPTNPLELQEPSPSVTFSPTSAREQRVPTQPQTVQAPMEPYSPIPPGFTTPRLPPSLPRRSPRIATAGAPAPTTRSRRYRSSDTTQTRSRRGQVRNTRRDSDFVMSSVAATDTAFGLTSVNLDPSGRPLTYQRATAGPDRALWEVYLTKNELLILLRLTAYTIPEPCLSPHVALCSGTAVLHT